MLLVAEMPVVPRTTSESVASVSEAFLPTASVSGTSIGLVMSSVASTCCGDEGATSVGSRKGSSAWAAAAMVIATR